MYKLFNKNKNNFLSFFFFKFRFVTLLVYDVCRFRGIKCLIFSFLLFKLLIYLLIVLIYLLKSSDIFSMDRIENCVCDDGIVCVSGALNVMGMRACVSHKLRSFSSLTNQRLSS